MPNVGEKRNHDPEIQSRALPTELAELIRTFFSFSFQLIDFTQLVWYCHDVMNNVFKPVYNTEKKSFFCSEQVMTTAS